MKTAGRYILITIVFSSFYAVLRYHVLKGVETAYFPLFTMNKILSFSGFILLVLSVALEPLYRKIGNYWLEIRKYIGRTGLVMIIMHSIMSLLLFRPEVYGKFFAADGTVNAIGGWSMLLGILGLTAYLIIFSSFLHMEEDSRFHQFIRHPLFGISALLLSAFHIAAMGFKGWFTPGEWPGGMPSITMVSIVIFISGMVLFLLGQLKRQ